MRNNYALVQAGIIFFCEKEAADVFVNRYDHLPRLEFEFDFRYVEGILRDDSRLKLGTKELQSMIHRTALKELFELMKQYCKDTKQTSAFTSAPWYQFARIVRNSFSHNYLLEFTNYDLGRLPVSWDGLTIDASMNGKELPREGFLTRAKLWKLIGEMEQYANALA